MQLIKTISQLEQSVEPKTIEKMNPQSPIPNEGKNN